MSKTKKTSYPWTIRVEPERREVIEQALNKIIEDEGFDPDDRQVRRKAFNHMIDRTLLGFGADVTPSQISRLHGKVECDLLFELQGSFFCMEGMRLKTKEPRDLGDDPDTVFLKCSGCQIAKERQREEWEFREARKDTIRKILEFRKLFLKVTKKGFLASVLVCTHNVPIDGALFFSVDGVTLPCMLQDGKAVKVENICKLVIDEETQKTGCRHLIEERHIVKPDVQKEAQDLKLEALELKEDLGVDQE